MPIYTVSQVSRYIRGVLDGDSLLADLWVSGEVSNLSVAVSGHRYFTLKDREAALRCVMFRNNTGGELLRNGAAVVVHGRVSLYEVRGDLQLYADMVLPEGLGERYLELERLKQRLQQEGLFEPSRKRPLPPFPRRIAVVTSPVGAVWHDIQTVARRRYPLVELVLVPCQVQGEGAVETILEAFGAVQEAGGFDLVILARGGGSLEELWPFNEEGVARAIFACPVPVVSAVGHETDVTIADLVADARAPTPSAAAEMAVPDRHALEARVAEGARSLREAFRRALEGHRRALQGLEARLRSRAPDIAGRRQRADDLLHLASQRIGHLLRERRGEVQGLRLRLEALSPASVLNRGYAVVARRDTGAPVTSPGQVAPGDPLHITVARGSFPARVEGP